MALRCLTQPARPRSRGATGRATTTSSTAPHNPRARTFRARGVCGGLRRAGNKSAGPGDMVAAAATGTRMTAESTSDGQSERTVRRALDVPAARTVCGRPLRVPTVRRCAGSVLADGGASLEMPMWWFDGKDRRRWMVARSSVSGGQGWSSPCLAAALSSPEQRSSASSLLRMKHQELTCCSPPTSRH
jgi:hypothetical protein